MQDADYHQIIAVFGYDQGVRQRHPALGRYMAAIDDWLRHHRLDDHQLQRYMLMGLWILYRAANHVGYEFRTQLDPGVAVAGHDIPHEIQRMSMFDHYVGRPIDDAFDYLARITGTAHDDFDGFPHGIFAYVLHGYGWNPPPTSEEHPPA